MPYYKIAPAEIGLYYRKGASVVVPVENATSKCKAVLTESGTVIARNHATDLSVEEMLEIYGGKIIDIEILNSNKSDLVYIHDFNFPKIKNKPALDRVYNKNKVKK